MSPTARSSSSWRWSWRSARSPCGESGSRSERDRRPRRTIPGPRRPSAAVTGDRRTGPRELSVAVTPRYRLMWGLVRVVVRSLFDVRATGLEHWPAPPFQIAANHHNGWDPLLIIAVVPVEPRITWFGPKEADFSRG